VQGCGSACVCLCKSLFHLFMRKSPNAILTSYPPPYEIPKSGSVTWRDAVCSSEERPSYLDFSHFGPEGMPRIKGRLLAQVAKVPVACGFWAAGFAFSRGDVVKKVPYDPNLPFLFFGEETLMSARLWTNGFDFFCPRRLSNEHKNEIFAHNETQKLLLSFVGTQLQADLFCCKERGKSSCVVESCEGYIGRKGC